MVKYKVGDKVKLCHPCGDDTTEVTIDYIHGDEFAYGCGGRILTFLLSDILEEPKSSVFIPKKGEKYYYNDSYGCMYHQLFEGTRSDDHRLNTGNCFRTKEDAEFYLFKLKMEQKMRIAFKDYPVDWNNDNNKYYIRYSTTHDVLVIVFDSTYKGSNIFCSNQEVVKKFVNENREDLIKYFKGV